MTELTLEECTAKILMLDRELAFYRGMQQSYYITDRDKVLEQCRELKKNGDMTGAIRHYRSKTDCSLREAHLYLLSL